MQTLCLPLVGQQESTGAPFITPPATRSNVSAFCLDVHRTPASVSVTDGFISLSHFFLSKQHHNVALAVAVIVHYCATN